MQYVYILTNKKRGTLCIETTRNLETRIRSRKTKEIKGFTSKYNLTRLVYYEQYETILEGVMREKHLKKWKRDGK